MARHFHSHSDQTNPSMIIHILDYKVTKGYPKVQVNQRQQGVSLDTQIEHFNPQWPYHIGLRQLIQDEPKSIN